MEAWESLESVALIGSTYNYKATTLGRYCPASPIMGMSSLWALVSSPRVTDPTAGDPEECIAEHDCKQSRSSSR